MKMLSTVFLIAFWSIFTSLKRDPCLPVIINEDIVTLGNQTYECGAIINADKVILKSGCRLRIPNGNTLIINAKEIYVESRYYIDAQGTNSNQRGTDRGYWMAHHGACCGHCFPTSDDIGHHDFEVQKGLGDGANQGGKGGPGGPGGTVVIKYCVITGVYGSGIGDIVVNTRGGQGGQGLTLDCPCHPNEKFTWRSGSQGDPGNNGSYKYEQRSNGCN